MTRDDPVERRNRVRALMREGRSDRSIARTLEIDRDAVRAEIAAIIEAADLDREGRIDALANRAGIVEKR